MRLGQSPTRPVNRDLNNPYPPFVCTLLGPVTPSRQGHEVLGQGFICSPRFTVLEDNLYYCSILQEVAKVSMVG